MVSSPKKRFEMKYWLIGSVALSLLPFIFVVITSAINVSWINVEKAILNGSLVMSSFLVIANAVVSIIRILKTIQKSKESTEKQKAQSGGFGLLLCLFLVAVVLLFTYVTVKTSYSATLIQAVVASLICLIISLGLSLGGEYYVQGVENVLL